VIAVGAACSRDLDESGRARTICKSLLHDNLRRRLGSFGAGERSAISSHPLAPCCQAKKLPWRIFLCQIDRLVPPIPLVIDRDTHPGSRSHGCRALQARTSHPSGSRLSGRSARNRSWPLALTSPRKPLVPDRVQSIDRCPSSGWRSDSILACGRIDRATAFLAHDRGVPACHTGTVFGDVVPRSFRRGKAGTPLPVIETRLMLCRIGGGVPISIGGSKPERCPGSPPPSSKDHPLIQRPS